MNIFVLSKNPEFAAKYHNDKHVIKMILESAQILCTVVSKANNIETPYKPTHINHPCTQWASKSLDNWKWLRILASYLNKEYRERYKKNVNHKSWNVIKTLPEPFIPSLGLTPFAQAMPKKYQNKDVVKAYREYYIHEKQHLAYWKNNKPDWYMI